MYLGALVLNGCRVHCSIAETLYYSTLVPLDVDICVYIYIYIYIQLRLSENFETINSINYL